MPSTAITNLSLRLPMLLACLNVSCAADHEPSVTAASEYASAESIGESGFAGAAAPVFDGGEIVETWVDKEPGWSGTGAQWTLVVATGCDEKKLAGTDAVVRAQKRQYDFFDRYKTETWVDRQYTLNNPDRNDNQYCSASTFGPAVLKSLTNPYAVVTRLRLWHDNTGSAPGWYVKWATLSWSDSRRSARYRCIFDRWIYGGDLAEAPCSPY